MLRAASLEVEAQGIPVESVLDEGTDGALQDIVTGHASRWKADLLVRAPAQVQASDAAQVRALGEASGYVFQMQA